MNKVLFKLFLVSTCSLSIFSASIPSCAAQEETISETVGQAQIDKEVLLPEENESADAALQITYNEEPVISPTEIKLRDPFAPSRVEEVSNDILQRN